MININTNELVLKQVDEYYKNRINLYKHGLETVINKDIDEYLEVIPTLLPTAFLAKKAAGFFAKKIGHTSIKFLDTNFDLYVKKEVKELHDKHIDNVRDTIIKPLELFVEDIPHELKILTEIIKHELNKHSLSSHAFIEIDKIINTSLDSINKESKILRTKDNITIKLVSYALKLLEIITKTLDSVIGIIEKNKLLGQNTKLIVNIIRKNEHSITKFIKSEIEENERLLNKVFSDNKEESLICAYKLLINKQIYFSVYISILDIIKYVKKVKGMKLFGGSKSESRLDSVYYKKYKKYKRKYLELKNSNYVQN